MLMYPGSPNIQIKLLTLISDNDEIGNSVLKLVKEKEVIGISKSITSKEYYESKKQEYKVDVALKILSFLYDGSKYAEYKDTVYKIERTYLSGQYIELYLMETNIKRSDINGNNG